MTFPYWSAGPSCFVALSVRFILPVNAEEKVMVKQFGNEHEAHMNRAKRFSAGVH